MYITCEGRRGSRDRLVAELFAGCSHHSFTDACCLTFLPGWRTPALGQDVPTRLFLLCHRGDLLRSLLLKWSCCWLHSVLKNPLTVTQTPLCSISAISQMTTICTALVAHGSLG